MKKAPVGDCWLKNTENLGDKKEKDLDFQMISDSSNEHVNKQLSGVLGNPRLVVCTLVLNAN